MNGPITNPALGTNLQGILAAEGGIGFVRRFISSAITSILIGGTIGFLFMLIIGGIQWVFSGGDKGAVEAARNRITHALLGLLVMFFAWAIVRLIEVFFTISILTLDITQLIIQ